MTRRRRSPSPAPTSQVTGAATAETHSPRAWRRGLGLGVLFLAVLYCYLPAMHSGFIWDDDTYVTENQTLRSTQGLANIWLDVGATVQYYPLLFTAWWLEYQAWGQNPAGYHVVNVILHAYIAIMMYFVLRRLSITGAGVAAAMFALHPVHVESVAWVTELKNVLSGAFYISSMLLYLRFERLGEPRESENRPRTAYVLALCLFACALLSKTATCSLPAALLLVLWWKRRRLTWATVAPLLPMFVMGIVLGLVTVWMEREVVGARGTAWHLSFLERTLIAGRAVWFYAAKTLFPYPLSTIYDRWEVDATVWWQYLFPILAVALVIVLWRLRRVMGTGPLVAVLIFGGTLLPALGFIDFYFMCYSYVGDRFQYLASMSLITLFVAGGSSVLSRLSGTSTTGGPRQAHRQKTKPVHVCVSAIVLVAFAVLTRRQAGIYENQETLWRATLKVNPRAWAAHNNLGMQLEATGDNDDAKAEYIAALKVNPDFVQAHKNLGVLLMKEGRYREAEAHLRRAVELAPAFAEGYGNLGICLAQQGRTAEAIDFLTRSVQIKPDYTAGYSNLGWVLAGRQRFEEAASAYRKALETDPGSAQANFNLGTTLLRLNRVDEAVDLLERALQIEPDNAKAYYNLGHAYLRRNQRGEAIKAFQSALRIDEQYAPARQALQSLQSTP